MTKETPYPETPTGSRFGWHQPARVEEFKKLVPESTETHRTLFRGVTEACPIVRVSIDLPKYRLANGRTISLQAEYLAKESGLRDDLFSGDQELWDAQEAQHRLLLQLAKQADLRKKFEYPKNIQVEPLVLDENGIVVNGNRRLATWRELFHQDPDKYGHFRYIDVAILPHADEREIDRLEAQLQVEKDIRADYLWHAEANMMLAKQKRDSFSNKELAEIYKKKESEIEELFDMRNYADQYLTSRGKKNYWSLVSDHEFAFRRIVQCRKRIVEPGKQEVFKQAAFALLDRPEDAGGRLYDAIPAILEHIDEISKELRQQFEVKNAAPSEELEDLLGGNQGVDPQGAGSDIPLAKEIQKPENSERARKTIVEVIETQKQLKKDEKDAKYLLTCCSRAQATLQAAVSKGLRPESKREGVEKQLVAIETQIAAIRKWLQNAKN